MRQVVAYKRLKAMKNYQTVSPNGSLGRLQDVVVYHRFQLQPFTWELLVFWMGE